MNGFKNKNIFIKIQVFLVWLGIIVIPYFPVLAVQIFFHGNPEKDDLACVSAVPGHKLLQEH